VTLELRLLATPKAVPELRHHLRHHTYDVRLCATELVSSGVLWLTWIRKEKGTVACQEISARVQVWKRGTEGTRAIWRKLYCLNPNLQRMQRVTSAGNPHLPPAPHPAVEELHIHRTLRVAELFPVREFKEMSGARTVKSASPMVTEAP
jgi:hypothetical protein